MNEKTLLAALDEEYMNAEQLAFFDQRLQQLRTENQDEITAIKNQMLGNSQVSDVLDRAQQEEESQIALRIAETFTFADEAGESLSQIVRLDTMITVVDAVNFLRGFNEARHLQEAGESLGEEDQRSVADLLVDQVEFCDVILISKTDLCTAEQLTELTGILKSLNTEAELIAIENGQVPLDKVLGTQQFSFEKAKQAAGWLKEMRQELVFIGQNLNPQAVTAQLNDCLLTDTELLAGKQLWQSLPDPFPAWDAA